MKSRNKSIARRVCVLMLVAALCVLILGAAYLAYMYLNASRTLAYTPPGADSIFVADANPSVSRLARLESDVKAWVTSLNSEYLAEEADYIATEEGRRELEQQKRLEREAFLQDMADLSEQQQKLQAELDARAEAEIAAMGGIDATSGDVVYDPHIPDSMQSSAPSTSAVPESPTVSPSLPVESPSIDTSEEYFGQFSAHMVCTCGQCLDSTEWANVSVGDCYILADSEYLPAGIQVILDSGSTATYPVKAAEEMVTGREILIFNPNHSEASGDPDLFPKITKKE